MNYVDLSKAQLNTTNDPKGWIEDWYADRENIWKSNQARLLLNDLSPEDYDYISNQSSPQFFVDGIVNLIENVIPDKAMEEFSIQEIGQPGIQAFNTGDGRTVISETSYNKPELRVHELIHGPDQEWRIPEMYVGELMDTTEPQAMFLKTTQPDYQYHDHPREMYARLMQFRNKAGLDPKKIYTIEDVKNWRNSGKYDDEFLFNRYTDEFILQLLNDVAYNEYSPKIYYSKQGTKLNNMKSVSLKNTGLLDNEIINYINKISQIRKFQNEGKLIPKSKFGDFRERARQLGQNKQSVRKDLYVNNGDTTYIDYNNNHQINYDSNTKLYDYSSPEGSGKGVNRNQIPLNILQGLDQLNNTKNNRFNSMFDSEKFNRLNERLKQLNKK